ncbi:MAG: hypothetical protein R3E08_12140 [Thiotrichaceae bacterium]
MSVLIIDYGLGNLGSRARFFGKCGAEVIISDEPQALRKVDRVILPGKVRLQTGWHNLRESEVGILRYKVGWMRRCPC